MTARWWWGDVEAMVSVPTIAEQDEMLAGIEVPWASGQHPLSSHRRSAIAGRKCWVPIGRAPAPSMLTAVRLHALETADARRRAYLTTGRSIAAGLSRYLWRWQMARTGSAVRQ